MLSVEEALATVLECAKPLPSVIVALESLPIDAVLAEPIESDIDSPPYTKAMMDGYALRSSDCDSVPRLLRIVEEIAAGKMPTKFIHAGEAARVMTGAPIPNGADAVVAVEKTETVSPAEVRIIAPLKSGLNILERGQEMKAGEVLLQPGVVLGPAEHGILACVGKTSLSVHPKPRIAVVPTGDEIVDPAVLPGPGQIRNTNGAMLLGQCIRAGGIPRSLGIARDTVESLRSHISAGLDGFDMLILSGGVSMGNYDLVPGVLNELGVTSRFHKVALKPGKPLFFGTRGKCLVFGLPGNPVSSFVCFELFIRPAIRKLNGCPCPEHKLIQLPISADFQCENDRPTFWPARTEYGEVGLKVTALPWFGSADLRPLHAANALLVIPPGPQVYKTNQPVRVILLDT